MAALQEDLGHWYLTVFLSIGGFLENKEIAKFSYFSLSFSLISSNLSSFTNAFEHSLKH